MAAAPHTLSESRGSSLKISAETMGRGHTATPDTKNGHAVFVPRQQSELAAWLARDALRHLNEPD